MAINNREFEQIVKGFNNPNPDIRFESVQMLWEIEEIENLTVNAKTLEWLIKEAGNPFPPPVDIWDDPSYQLIHFATNFVIPVVAESLIKYYPHFSMAAKEEVIRYLCLTDGEKHKSTILNMIDDDISINQAIFPLEELFKIPSLVIAILKKHYKHFENDEYKEVFYKFLSFSLDNEYLQDFKPDYIVPILLDDYHKQRELYIDYNKDYNPRFVFSSWKETYLIIRSNMTLYLSLMEYYWNDEFQTLIEEAIQYKDPIIKSSAVITALQRNIPVNDDFLAECATNIESSEFFYLELLRIQKDSMFPVKENKQEFFAKCHLFHYIVTEHEFFPDNINLIEKVDTTNQYNQPVRYYFASVVSEGSKTPAWVGAYALEEDNDSIDMWEGTFLEEGEFDRTREEYIQSFLENREMERHESDSEIFYSSKSTIKPWFYLVYVVLVARAYKAFSTMDMVYIILTICFALIILFLHFRKWKQSRRIIHITGSLLKLLDRNNEENIKLENIKEVTVRKANFKSRLFDRTAKLISVYDKKGKLTMEIPFESVNYSEFSFVLDNMTKHLQEPPLIEKH
ncbi:hypothetical protein BIV60_20280 [Bacillus sp. MUM 116]|uniref:hypothetical protein n=1 Tax=Bacillus sp. MUM 116 TaxID=1678002 RepID=UPI0008F5CFE3|nr:hypothetical protein [Bacillus sp. MUM 116]OIK10809.1 hypothetical protein BIV60_20280 [Bacillus sp. MUM 116]